jgi:hypothetical protein
MRKIALTILAASAIWAGCKVEDQFDGPDLNDLYGPFSIEAPLTISQDSVDFSLGENPVFSASFSKKVNWKLSIKGLSSGAQRIQETFDSDVHFTWNGNTTIFPLFRSEVCAVELTVDQQPDTLRDTIFIIAPKVNQGLLLSDFESGLNSSWNTFVQSGASMNFGLQSNGYAPQGVRSYVMEGAVSWDWLIGLVDIPATAYGSSHFDLSSNSSNVYFNTLLYKHPDYDNGIVLLQFREDDNEDGSYTDGAEDMFSVELKGGADGWRLVSLKYDDLATLVNGAAASPIGNGIHEPHKLMQVSILFLANPSTGFSSSGLDYMIFTEGGPLAP